MPIGIEPITAEIGAVVTGVDLAKPLAAEELDAIQRALLDHLALVFYDQTMTPGQHIDFALQLGEIQEPPVKTKHGDEDPRLQVLDQVAPKGQGADSWHTDHSYTATPAMGSILRAVKLPKVGGDTLIGSMYAAYDALSGPVKRMLDGLTAAHDVTKSATRGIRAGNLDTPLAELQAKLPPVVHPVIRTHPSTGRKLLYVNSNSTTRILELEEDESEMVLHFLFDHVHKPEFQLRHRWKPDSLVYFDNRCCQHYAVPDYQERRVLHRVTLRGDRPY